VKLSRGGLAAFSDALAIEPDSNEKSRRWACSKPFRWRAASWPARPFSPRPRSVESSRHGGDDDLLTAKGNQPALRADIAQNRQQALDAAIGRRTEAPCMGDKGSCVDVLPRGRAL